MEGLGDNKNEIKTFNVPSNDNNSVLFKLSKERIIELAFVAHSEGKLFEANKYYQLFIDQGFNDPRVFSNYGMICHQEGKIKKAINLFERSIRLFPRSSDAYINLGNILQDIGENKKAEIITRKALEIKPGIAMGHYNLGVILRSQGKLVEAEIEALKSIKYNPSSAAYHSNLGLILIEKGEFEKALYQILTALDLEPNNKNYNEQLINILMIYKPQKSFSNNIIRANNEFNQLCFIHDNLTPISDDEIVNIYQRGFSIYNKYKLSIDYPYSQIYKKNSIDLHCDRHKFIFNTHKIIPEFCFSCYKVQIKVKSILQLLKLFVVFENIKIKNNNTRKCLIELRPNIEGTYKGLIYCSSIEEADLISLQLNEIIKNKIDINLISTVKRGCSEYKSIFPEYNDINRSGDQSMKYDKNWREIEKKTDNEIYFPKKANTILNLFNLNNFLVIRNWIAYAQLIRDKSVKLLTDEEIVAKSITHHLRGRTYNHKNHFQER